MTRDEFRQGVFARDGGRCVICGSTVDLDAHHIVERRLWDDEGYHLDNGATLCGIHHIQAEQTALSCEEIRQAAGIVKVVLPNTFDRDEIYDKWGNVILPDGRRVKGELFWDDSVQKILAGVMSLFSDLVKYPKIYHLPWSESVDEKTDRLLTPAQVAAFAGKRVIVSEKLDGENTSCYRNYIHARSLDGRSHPSRGWVKADHAKWGYDIPEHWRVCGENLTAEHSIRYETLPTFFLMFGIYNERNECLAWDDAVIYSHLLGLTMVPVLYDGIFDEGKVRACYTGKSVYGPTQEGYVIRLADKIPWAEHRTSFGKFVRKNHVQTAQNWMNRPMKMNGRAVSPVGC